MKDRKRWLLRHLVLGIALTAAVVPAAQAAVDRGIGDTPSLSKAVAESDGTTSWFLGQGLLSNLGSSQINQRQMEQLQLAKPTVVPYLSHGVVTPSAWPTQRQIELAQLNGRHPASPQPSVGYLNGQPMFWASTATAPTRSGPPVGRSFASPDTRAAAAATYDSGINSTYDALRGSHPDVAEFFRGYDRDSASALSVDRKADAYTSRDFAAPPADDGVEIGWREIGVGAGAGSAMLVLCAIGIALARNRRGARLAGA